MIDTLSVVMSLAVAPWSTLSMPGADAPSCDVSAVESVMEDAAGWKDVSPGSLEDPELEAYFENSLPGYRLAYLHRESLGVLLVDGRELAASTRLGTDSPAPDRRWSRVADAARAACAETAESCEVAMLPSLPMGVSADSVLSDDSAGETLQRVTVAFDGPGRCAYSVQFTSPIEAFSAPAWRKLRDELISLRKIVMSRHESRPNSGF